MSESSESILTTVPTQIKSLNENFRSKMQTITEEMQEEEE